MQKFRILLLLSSPARENCSSSPGQLRAAGGQRPVPPMLGLLCYPARAKDDNNIIIIIAIILLSSFARVGKSQQQPRAAQSSLEQQGAAPRQLIAAPVKQGLRRRLRGGAWAAALLQKRAGSGQPAGRQQAVRAEAGSCARGARQRFDREKITIAAALSPPCAPAAGRARSSWELGGGGRSGGGSGRPPCPPAEVHI